MDVTPVAREPLDPGTAKALIRKVLELPGGIRWSGHVFDELVADKLTTLDAVNVLRDG